MSEQATIETVKVSEQTAHYISIKRDLDLLYNSIYKGLEKQYGEEAGDILFERDFADKLCEVTKVVEDYLAVSIYENMNKASDYCTI